MSGLEVQMRVDLCRGGGLTSPQLAHPPPRAEGPLVPIIHSYLNVTSSL